MKALWQDRYGRADVLTFRDVDQPKAGARQVLVRVVAAGVDRGAWHFMTGEPYLMRLLGFGLRAPSVRVPGTNFAGVVEAVGPDVVAFRPGDEVYGAARGTFAEHAVASVDAVAPKPAELSFEEAAVLPYAAFTALQAVRDHGGVQAGQRVLVVGASGAVGTVAVQLAAARGARVTAVCSSRSAEVVRSLGATDVVDYHDASLWDGARRYDVIIDVFGRTPLRRLRRVLERTGTLVIVGGEGDRWTGGLQRQLAALVLNRFVRQRLVVFVVKEHARELHEINELVAAGQVRPVLGRAFALADGAAAVAALEAGSVGGRITICPYRGG